MLTDKESLVFESYFTFSLLTELKNNNFLESDAYKEMNFGAPWIKDELKKRGIDNRGCLLMAFYVMLVIPKESIESEEYDSVELFLRGIVRNTKDGYKKYDKKNPFLCHIRNSIAHAKVEFQSTGVVFKDSRIVWEKSTENRGKKQKKIELFSTQILWEDIGKFLQKLQTIHLKYIEYLQNKIKSSAIY